MYEYLCLGLEGDGTGPGEFLYAAHVDEARAGRLRAPETHYPAQ